MLYWPCCTALRTLTFRICQASSEACGSELSHKPQKKPDMGKMSVYIVQYNKGSITLYVSNLISLLHCIYSLLKTKS